MANKKSSPARRKRKHTPQISPQIASQLSRRPSAPSEALLHQPSSSWWWTRFAPGLAIFTAALIYAYWPTLLWVVDAWRTEPDYSHGFFVVPLAAIILYHRTDFFPGVRSKVSYWGLSLIVLAIAMRFASRMIYADFLDGWSMVPLIAGTVWFLWGWAAMRWALPAIAFLILMIPMPYQAESLLSWKLQGVATDLSTIMLRVFGQPAIADSHVIWIQDERLMVEQACSGLRIFIGVGALAYFWAAISNRLWIDRVVILASAIPLAILANSIRITSVGLFYSFVQSEDARSHIHDITGFAMIGVAFGLLWLVKTYWQHLYREVKQATAKDFVPGHATSG